MDIPGGYTEEGARLNGSGNVGGMIETGNWVLPLPFHVMGRKTCSIGAGGRLAYAKLEGGALETVSAIEWVAEVGDTA